MLQITRFLNSRSIRTKLLLYFLFLILLPITTVGVIGNLAYTRSLEEEANAHTAAMIDQVKTNVEYYIRNMENIARLIAENDDTVRFLRIGPDTPGDERLHAQQALSSELSKFTGIHPEISGILVVNASDMALSNEMIRVARDPLTEEFWYQAAMRVPEQMRLISKPSGRNIRTSQNVSADDVVSVVKALQDPDSGAFTGVVLIDMKLDVIERAIKDIRFGKSGFLYVMDGSGDVVYAPVNAVVYRVRGEWLADSQSVVRVIGGVRYQILFSDSEYTNWKIVGIFSLNETLAAVADLRNVTLWITGATLIIAIIVALFFTSSIAKPLGKLRLLMKRAESGNLGVHFKSKYDDEIGQLGNSFNNMIGEIRKLIDLVYIEQQHKREAELKILQAQIKPHFLYNTLDTIQWMAQEHQAEDIVEMVGTLTKLFRLGLSNGEEMLSLRQELDHARSYMIIQKARYEDKFIYDITCGESLLNCRVLKLILQPLVENSIYHGLKEKRSNGMVAVSARREGDALVLAVMDDGVGIAHERAAALAQMLTKNAPDDSSPADSWPGGKPGYGIFNVHARIRLSFGPAYGIRFVSLPGGPTTFEIVHPLLEG